MLIVARIPAGKMPYSNLCSRDYRQGPTNVNG